MKKISWKNAFTQSPLVWKDEWSFGAPVHVRTLAELKDFLDYVHIKHCLLRPLDEVPDYPLVDPRELLPSFEADMWEHKQLPGFSLVAFERELDYFQEVFQYDCLHVPCPQAVKDTSSETIDYDVTHEVGSAQQNLLTLQQRLPRAVQESLRSQFSRRNLVFLENYPLLMPYALQMDRAQVMALDAEGHFHLGGVYASLPSDMDTEIKRFGLRIGKFSLRDNALYEKNRTFVLQYLMELYGFPVVSERRTSAALFSRRLHKMGERFLVRTLSQSDRTLTTIYNKKGKHRRYPLVEKIALVTIDAERKDLLGTLTEQGFMVDVERRIVILKVSYKQHKYSADNVRQERALSVDSQEIIHPLSGAILSGINLLKDSSSLVLRLNDIVQGEHQGRIAYKRVEIVEDTDTEEKKLKFLHAWLTKHQRRIISYGDEFYAKIKKILDAYLLSAEYADIFATEYDLHKEVLAKYAYIHQARKVRLLEDISCRTLRGERLTYQRMLGEAVNLLHDFKFEIASYFDSLVLTVINIGNSILNDSYLRTTYISRADNLLSAQGLETKRTYGKLVTIMDEIIAIRRSRVDSTVLESTESGK